MHDDAAGERLVGVERGLVALAEVADDLVVVLLGADRVGPAALGLDHGVGRGEVLRGQDRREDAVGRGAARIEALVHRAEGFAQAHRLRCGQPERPRHLLLVQPHQLADGRGRAEHAGGAGDVPADIVMVRIDRVADPALGLDAEHQRVEEILARDRLHLRQREDRRGDRTGGMDDRLQMGVVIVEDVARHAVDEGGVHDVEPLAPAEQRGLLRPGERPERRDRDIDRLVMRAADGDADPVQQRAHAFLAHIGRQVVITRGDEIMRQRARHLLGWRCCGRCGRRLREGGVGADGCERQRGRRLEQGPAISVHRQPP